MPKIEIVQMGPPPDNLNLKGVVKTANRAQEYFNCVLGDPINTLGSPNTDGEYTVTQLATLLETRRRQNNAETEIGVIDAPLYDELFSGVDAASNNIVISITPVESLLSGINKSKADYVLLEVGAQLLTIEYRRQTNLSVEPEVCERPWHKETRSCLFDYCDHPPHTLKKLKEHRLCAECQSILESANIRGSVISACRDIVKKGVQAKVLNILRDVFSDPFGRAAFGGLFLLLMLEILGIFGLSHLEVGGLIVVLLLLVLLKELRKPGST